MRLRSIVTSIALLMFTTSMVGCAVVCDQCVADEPEAIFPTKDVVVATQPIEQGADIDSDMVAMRSVPVDETNEWALSDPTQVVGEVATIDILLNQIVMPNMLSAFPDGLPLDDDPELIEVDEEQAN